MQKNVASQKKVFFAFDTTTGAAKTGDAANITPYESIDYGAVTAITDTSMTEMDATNAKGYYVCDLTQAETNGNEILFSAKSSTANISVIGAPALVATVPSGFSGSVAQTGDSYAVVNSGTFGNSALKTLIDTVDDFLDTEVAAIKAKTDNLPSDPADASDIAGAFTTLNTKIDTIDDFLDTEVAAIKAKTDNLPSDPADASDIAGSFATVNTKLDTIDDFLDTEVAAIKTQTDKMVFTVTNQLDVNVLSVDSVDDAADRLQKVAQGNVFCTVGAASSTTSIVTSAMSPAAAVTDQFKGRIVTFKNDTTTANLRGQSTDITGSTALGVLAVTALTDAPAIGDVFTIS